MDARLQRRVQRYGWDRAVDAYARHWHGPLAGVHGELLDMGALSPGEAVLDVACGTGVVSRAAARAVGPAGRVLGVEIADAMVQAARQRAQGLGFLQAGFARMEAEQLALPDASMQAGAYTGGVSDVHDLEMATSGEEETRLLGERVGNSLRRGDILLLSGDLGTGKT